jgi:hypothetical protein
MKYVGFIGGSYTSASVAADAQKCMNLYVETDESGQGKSAAQLLGTPGLAVFCTLATTPVRGTWAGGAPLSTGGRLFAVGGSKLYEVFSGGTSTLLGDVGDDATHTPVQMFPNGNQLAIISAGNYYIDNGAGPVQVQFTLGRGAVSTVNSGSTTIVTRLSGDVFGAGMVGGAFVLGGTGFSGGTSYTVASVADENTLVLTTNAGTNASIVYNAPDGTTVTATTGCFLDGYFILQIPDTKKFIISALNDGTYFNELDFAIKEGYPDNIGSLLADHEELWIFGETTSEVWRNDGGTATNSFPFERDPGAFIHQGIAATFTAVSFNNGVAWLGTDTRGGPVAWRAQGYVPIRVSTHAVEVAWASYATVADAMGFVYVDRGHNFWVISFPTGNATWVYDATENSWHERGFWSGSANVRHMARCHADVFGKHIVGDYNSGILYDMSLAYFTDAGTAIHRVRAAPHASNEDNFLFFSRFRLDAENTGALAPALDWSIDGAITFGTVRTTTSQTAGAFARYDYRRLGRSRDRVFRISIQAAVRVALVDAYLDFIAGTP